MDSKELRGLYEAYKQVNAPEEIEELYKGKHGQSDKEYADSRSQGGKMVSGTSKMSGAEYTHGRRVKAANPGMQPDVGGKTKPKSQGKMDRGTRADIEYRKANLKKEELDIFDTVLEFLQVEGYAETLEEAQELMTAVVLEAQAARNNPEKYERESRKSETKGQSAERRVRDRLKTMDPKRAEAMKAQMRAVGLNV